MDITNHARKDEKTRELIRELAARFVSLESNRSSLVTVTDVQITEFGKKALVLFTVLPDDKQDVVLDFLSRKRSEFQKFVRDNSRIGRVPQFNFAIDFGEKNRQRADELLSR